MDPFVRAAVDDMVAARDELDDALARIADSDWERYVPYGSRTLHDLLTHIAGADHAWAVAARGLLRTEGAEADAPPPAQGRTRRGSSERRRRRDRDELTEEMARRRRLLLSLYELLEPRHLAVGLRAYGSRHNSVRERIWVGYHDRMHAADVRRALRMNWHPQPLAYLPELRTAAEALSPDETLHVIFSADPVNWELPSPVAGWTFRQLLAHIATGDWVFQAHLRSVIETGAPSPSVTSSVDVAAGNAERLDARATSTHNALVEEFLSMRHETLRLLAALRPEHLSVPFAMWWLPDAPQRTLLDYIIGFPAHEETHREQLRPAMRHVRAAGGV